MLGELRVSAELEFSTLELGIVSVEFELVALEFELRIGGS